MNNLPGSLGPRERQIVELLLKAHFNRLYLRFGISDGIKRVKLATLMYRAQTPRLTNSVETVSTAKQQNAA